MERPAGRPAARLGDSARQRKAASLAIALLIEALIILLLFTLGTQIAGDKQASEIVTEFAATDFAPEPEAEPRAAARTTG